MGCLSMLSVSYCRRWQCWTASQSCLCRWNAPRCWGSWRRSALAAPQALSCSGDGHASHPLASQPSQAASHHPYLDLVPFRPSLYSAKNTEGVVFRASGSCTQVTWKHYTTLNEFKSTAISTGINPKMYHAEVHSHLVFIKGHKMPQKKF